MNIMPNIQNLKPFEKNRSSEEAMKNGRIGGIKSGESRRRKKDLKQTLDLLLSKRFSLSTKGSKSLNKQLENMGYKKVDNQTALVYTLFMTAMNGGKNSVSAFNSIRDTLGEKPKEEVEVNGQVSYEDALRSVCSKDEY